MRRFVLLLLLLVTPPAVSAEPVRVVVAVYVAVDGRDDADGAKAHPLATLEAARSRVRKLKADAGGKMPPGGITVYLRGGRYPLHTFILGQADSGTPDAPMTYRSAPRETAVLDGGFAIPSSAFKPVADHDKKLLARLHPAARGRVVVADLRARDLHFESARWQPIVVTGGSDNLIAGCSIRNCGGGVTITGGTNNGITGCDIVDVGGHQIELAGGDQKTLTPAGNFATNNHLTQTAHDSERGVRVRGVGNVFANNLLHDFVGQGIVYEGNSHLIERNEIYNVGIEEGDGGATYCGAQLWSYGNVIRHNFIHHLLCVPGAHPHGGVYLDDLDAGDTVYGNVFYKAAHRAVLVNGGPANVVANNIFLSGYIGIYSTGVYAAKARDYAKRYNAGQLKRGDKMDYLWRCEQVVGKAGWDRPPWSTKYPQFRKVMAADFYNPIECSFTNNYFHANAKQDVWLNKVPDGTIEVRGHRPITPAAFVDPKSLDFRFKRTFQPHRDFKPIPFEKIGLHLDRYRKSMPSKPAYRRAGRRKLQSRPTYDPNARYDPKTINDLLYPDR